MNRICHSILKVSESVRAALAHNRPVVALESTIISHGMPYPQNKQCANSIENAIRSQGAEPATVAIFDGKIHVGLSSEQINRLAEAATTVRKVSRRDLPYVIANKQIGATTVSATMIAANAAGIDLFVTGGIGGVHRGFQHTMDVSADLEQLAKTPVTVVSAGVKSILDIARTLEYLQTKGVPVVTHKSKNFPAFFSSDSGLPSPFTANSELQCANLIFAHQKLGLENGILVAVPNDKPAEGHQIEQAIQKAIKQSEQQKISGAKITPFLLKRVNEITQGASLRSNISLVHNNAIVGARIAGELAKLKEQSKERLKNIDIFNMKNESSIKSSATKIKEACKSRFQGIKPKGKIIAIGGCAIDIQLTPKLGHKFQLHKSCIGKTRISLGGVARNVVDCSSKLGIQTVLISALGADKEAQTIRSFCGRKNIKLVSIQDSGKAHSSSKYYAILDHQNNQFLGISQMQINELLTFDNIYSKYFKHQKQLPAGSPDKISKQDIVVIDSNIPQCQLKSVVKYCAEELDCLIVYEAKGQKTKRIVTSGAYQYVDLIKMNFMEKKQIQTAIKAMAKYNNQQVQVNKWLSQQLGAKRNSSVSKIKSIITKGAENIQLIRADSDICQLRVPKPIKIQKTTGAGDTFTATYCSMLLYGLSEQQALLYARAASKLNIESAIKQSVITQNISLSKLQQSVKQIKEHYP